MRPPREGEFVCTCRAYKFPHRFGGGKCSGIHLAVDHWSTHYGHDRTCRRCPAFDTESHSCQVIDGGEAVVQCEVYLDFVHANGVKIYPAK